MKELNLQTTLENISQGDTESFSHLYNHLYDKVYGYTFNRTMDHSACEDIVSNSFIKLLESIKKFNYKNDAAFYGWLFKIVRSQISNYYRKQNKYALKTEYFDDDTANSLIDTKTKPIGHQIDADNDQMKLAIAMQQLNKKEKEIIQLYYFADLSHRDTGSIMKMSEGAARVALHRTVKKLATIMKTVPGFMTTELERTTQ